jgi:hypothetical protein
VCGDESDTRVVESAPSPSSSRKQLFGPLLPPAMQASITAPRAVHGSRATFRAATRVGSFARAAPSHKVRTKEDAIALPTHGDGEDAFERTTRRWRSHGLQPTHTRRGWAARGHDPLPNLSAGYRAGVPSAVQTTARV